MPINTASPSISRISKGAKEIKIHGEYWAVRAEISHLDSMSAHADRDEVLTWIQGLKKKPSRVFVTHGEPMASDELRRCIQEKLGIQAIVPEFEQSFSLGATRSLS